MRYPGKERRKHSRYEADLKIDFCVGFDIETKIDFRVRKESGKEFSHKKYPALGQNVSAEGLSFSSKKILHIGDILSMDVYVPSASKAIRMEGEVKWSRLSTQEKDAQEMYDTGVRLLKVKEEDVGKSVSIDPRNNVVWSIVLESVFGSFKELTLQRKMV